MGDSSSPSGLTLAERLAAAQREVEGLKGAIEQRRARLADGRLASAVSGAGAARSPGAALRAVTDATAPRKAGALEAHAGKVCSVDWVGAERLVSVGNDGAMLLWNARTRRKLDTFALKSPWVMACAVEKRDLGLVAVGGLDNVCTVYSLAGREAAAKAKGGGAGEDEDARIVVELAGHDGYVSSCAFVWGPERVLTSSGDGSCVLWDVSRGASVSTFRDHAADVMTLASNPSNDSVFVSGSCDATAKVWDLRACNNGAGGCVMTFEGHESDVNSVAFMRSGAAFATGSDDSCVRLFDLRSCACVNELRSEDVTHGVTSVAFSASGRLVFAGYDNSDCLAWDCLLEQASRPAFALNGHNRRVSSVSVSSTGHAVATGSWDASVQVWVAQA